MQKKKKEKWGKPKLIILSRGRPEEAVLALCKANVAGPTSFNAQVSACGSAYADDPEKCAICEDFNGT